MTADVKDFAEAKAKRARRAAPEHESDDFMHDDTDAPDLPVIKLTPNLHSAVDATVAALAHDCDIYQRDGILVRPVRVAEAEAVREKMAPGTPQIRPVAMATLRERCTRMARFVKFDRRSHEWRQTLPPDTVVAAVAARGEWPGLRTLTGIIETPSMRPDGSIIDAVGYDAATGYLYLPQRDYPAIPEHPSIDDARSALARLVEPFRDFPWSGKADPFVAVAALVTLVCRPAVSGAVPAFAFDASTRGSGKTLVSRAVTTLAQGREASLMNWPNDDDEELQKILGSYALKGASVILWDNIAGTFGGAALDRTLTCADRVELRVLGKSEVPSLAWRAVTLGNGNNMVFGADTTRRILVGRIEPNMERPEERTNYSIVDLPAWCRENHPRAVADALTVVRGYVVAGRPDQGLAGWGSFEAWRDLPGSALVWAGGEDVMSTRPTLSGEDDSDTAALRTIVELWSLLAPEGLTIRNALGALYPPLQRNEARAPDKYDPLREALETLAPPRRPGEPPGARQLGNALSRYRRRVVGRKCLDHVGSHAGTATWGVREVKS